MTRTISVDPTSDLAKQHGAAALADDPLFRWFEERELLEVACLVDQDGAVAVFYRPFDSDPWDSGGVDLVEFTTAFVCDYKKDDPAEIYSLAVAIMNSPAFFLQRRQLEQQRRQLETA
jgi:hypothetical protein